MVPIFQKTVLFECKIETCQLLKVSPKAELILFQKMFHYKDQNFRKWSIFLAIIVRIYTLFLACPWPLARCTALHLTPSLSEWLIYWVIDLLKDWVRKLKISVNIDARTLKFGIEHPWAHWLWFRKNHLEGSYEDHVLAIKGPYFGHF